MNDSISNEHDASATLLLYDTVKTVVTLLSVHVGFWVLVGLLPGTRVCVILSRAALRGPIQLPLGLSRNLNDLLPAARRNIKLYIDRDPRAYCTYLPLPYVPVYVNKALRY